MRETERLEAIDRLAARMLLQPRNEGRPATEVWDEAADRVDRRRLGAALMDEAAGRAGLEAVDAILAETWTFEAAEAAMRAAGADHGKAAGSWYFNPGDEATARRVLQGIEDGDPEVLDTFPHSPLSGEWADGPTPTSVFADVLGVAADDDRAAWIDTEHDLLRAYEDAFREAAADEIERSARALID